MPATTVVTDDAATTVISEDTYPDGDAPRSRFSWSAALAGAFVATAVTFFLVTLGSGVGLSLTTTPALLHGATPTFLTLGAVYFLAAQAFGFAAGGHIVGRLISPAVETAKEEEFRAGAHGLAVWAIAVVATATMAAIAGFVAEGSAPNAFAAFATPSRNDGGLTPATTGYWVDTLFRAPANQPQASLAWRKYAQAASTVGTDAAPAPMQNDQATAPPQQTVPPASDDESGAQAAPSDQQIAPANSGVISAQTPSGGATQPVANTAMDGTPVAGRNVAADKMEAGRILNVGMADGGRLTLDDRDQLAFLVSQDTGLAVGSAQRRVDTIEARIHDDEVKAADTARKVAGYASLWAALALLFGAIVATMAAVSARWEDDRVSFLPFGRRIG